MIGPVIAGTTIFTTIGPGQLVKGHSHTKSQHLIELVSDAPQSNSLKRSIPLEDSDLQMLDENVKKAIFEEISPEKKQSIIQAYLKTRFDELTPLNDSKPSFEVYQRGVIGYTNLLAQGKVKNEILTVIDFSISSKKKRLWIIDMKENKVINNKLVAHGKNSGFDIPTDFGNTRHSNKSSLGFYLTGENYDGKYGLSLRLDGQEDGFNSNARERAVVMHRAKYVNNDIIKSSGRLGRSFGCPALDWTEDSTQIMKDIANKSVIYIYSPQEDYISTTKLYDLDQAFDYLQKDLYVLGQAAMSV